MGNLLYICICILFRKLKYFTNINTTRPVDFLAVQAGSQEAVASRHKLTHSWRERERDTQHALEQAVAWATT